MEDGLFHLLLLVDLNMLTSIPSALNLLLKFYFLFERGLPAGLHSQDSSGAGANLRTPPLSVQEVTNTGFFSPPERLWYIVFIFTLLLFKDK